MKLHSFANPCIFIGHFPLNIIKKKVETLQLHTIWFHSFHLI